ncbi:MAG: hypothetical protein RR335_12035, partial [Eubacterium sp.]
GVFPYPANCFQVMADSGMRLKVMSGKTMIQGRFAYDDAVTTINIDPAHASFGRIDRIVLRLDFVNRRITIEKKTGKAATSPVAPTLTRSSDLYELCLCEVTIGKGATTLYQASITDTRRMKDLCGLVSPVTDVINPEDFNRQLNDAFIMWFKDCKNTLGEDSAGKLLIKIDNNKKDIETKAEAIDKKIDTHILDYKKLENEKKKLFSVKMAGDFVYGYNEGQSVLRPIPFSDTRPGYYRKTDYAELQSNGEIKITKKGNYKVEMKVFISDSPGMNGTYHFLIQKNREHLSENYTPTSTINPNNICAGSTGMTEILNVGDIINGYIAPPRYSSLYRIDGAITWLNIIPLSFL